MVDDITKRLAQASLINAGFRPARYSAPIRLIRRVLWPFVRPFHFHLLDVILSLPPAPSPDELPASDKEGLRIDALREQMNTFATRNEMVNLEAQLALERASHATRDELVNLLTQLALHRSEFTALLNRHLWLENAVDSRDEAQQVIETAVAANCDQTTTLLQRILASEERETTSRDEVSNRLGALTVAVQELQQTTDLRFEVVNGHLSGLGTRQSDLEQRVLPTQNLFLSSTQGGVFLLLRGELICDTADSVGYWDKHILQFAEQCHCIISRRNSTKDFVAVDAGAHFGLISIPLARIFGRVLSFEPNEFNHRILLANVALNGLSGRVDARQEGLSATPTTLSLAPSEKQEIPLPLDDAGHLQPTHASNLGAYSFMEGGSGISETKGYPLDMLHLKNLAFMKVDVQGADGEVLIGALKTISECRPWLVFEWETYLSRAFSVTFEEISARLGEQDYKVRVLHRHNEKQIDYVAVPSEDLDELDRFLAKSL